MNNYIAKAILAMACIALTASTAGAGKFSPALQMDTYTDASSEDKIFGDEDAFRVASENGQPVQIAYLTFAGMTTLPQQVSYGTLSLYVTEVERPGRVKIHLYDQAAMDTITWADQPDFDQEVLGSLDIQEPGWQTWDATAFVKKAAEECSEGCPFSLVLVASGDASIAFASLEGAPEERPVLEYEAF